VSSERAAFDRVLRNLNSPASKRSYKHDWSRFLVWLELEGLKVTEVKPRHIEDHLSYLQQDKECKRSTCGRALSVIREVYGALVRAEIVAVNPAREVKNPKFDSSPNAPYLNEEQVGAMLNLPRDSWREKRDGLVVSLLFGLGWRRAEVAALRVDSFKAGTVSGIVKGGKRLTVGVPDWVMDELEEWCRYAGVTEALLPRSEDDLEAMTPDMVYQAVQRQAARADVKISPHGLRRTNITLGGEFGVPLKERQLSVGHSSLTTTERYDRARDAASKAPGNVFGKLIKGRR
jgi:site-specific recombinase XerD